MNGAPDQDIAVFTEALRLPPEERECYLSEACKGDAEFRRRVEALLQAYQQAGDFLGRPAAEMPRKATPLPVGEKPGERIGHYKLLQQIGEGGCGVVYLAEQEEPVRRRVALKIIKPGMDTKSVIARFEAERQALALMDHPNIAHVFDAGATESGRPFFVMELVKGVKLTDYCDQHSLSLDARLELLIQVCDAIQHAHQKGIIHRDIKPSNILVTTGPDRKPMPKVIDFGIAKAITGQQLTDKTIFTAYEMLIGTPAYMSPEQAALAITDVDTRTDIYSLGVLLYELLTGTTPFDTRELLKVGFDEVRRVIRTEQPVRPSTRLSTIMAQDPASFSKHHGEEAPKLIRQMRGELDWIVMKTLEKDRTRRYATANGLAMDIQRYLAGEPVLACPPSWLYQFRKLVSRHKLEFAALGIVLATLVAGLSSTIWSLSKAKVEATRSQQVTKFLQQALNGADAYLALGRDTTLLEEILEKAMKNMDLELTNQPAVLADLKLTIGGVYGSLLQADKAERLIREALAFYRQSPHGSEQKISAALSSLSMLHLRQDRFQQAEQEALEALNWESKAQGGLTWQTISLRGQVAWARLKGGKTADAEKMFRDAFVDEQRLAKVPTELLLDTRAGLATALKYQGNFQESERLLRESISIGREKLPAGHPYVADDLFRLGLLLERQNRFDEAEKCERQCLDIRRKMLPKGHPLTHDAALNLTSVLIKEGKMTDAADVYGQLFDALRLRLGDQDANVLRAAASFGRLLTDAGNDVQFEQLARQFPVVWTSRAEALARGHRWPEALAAASKVVELQPTEHGGYHLVAPLLVQIGDRSAYEALCQRITTQFAGATDPYTADRMAKDCLILPRPGADLKVPAELAETAVTRGQKDAGALPFFQCCKALAEYRQGHFEAAADWARRASDISSRYALAEACAILAMTQFQLNQTQDSRANLKKCDEVIQAQLLESEDVELDQDWRDWIIAHALLTEAKSTIEVK